MLLKIDTEISASLQRSLDSVVFFVLVANLRIGLGVNQMFNFFFFFSIEIPNKRRSHCNTKVSLLPFFFKFLLLYFFIFLSFVLVFKTFLINKGLIHYVVIFSVFHF